MRKEARNYSEEDGQNSFFASKKRYTVYAIDARTQVSRISEFAKRWPPFGKQNGEHNV